MYRQAFPRCTVIGSVKPVPYFHFIETTIPEKCSRCENLFEGCCVRAIDQVQNYLPLDYGPCPVKGSAHPVQIEASPSTSKFFVPAKCTTCQYFQYDETHGIICKFYSKIGASLGSLDWTGWEPDYPNIGLSNQRVVSPEMMLAVATEKEVSAIKIFRQEYPGVSIREARDAYAELLAQLKHIQENEKE